MEGEAISSGYEVAFSGTSGVAYYSLDGGTTQLSFDNTTSPLTNITNISLKALARYGVISGTINGESILIQDNTPYWHSYTLTQNAELDFQYACIEENEYIETVNGLKQAKDLQVSDELMGVSGNNKIIELETSISNNCYKLTLSNNEEVIFTGSHLLLNQDLSIIRVCDLVVGQTLYNNIILENIEKLEGDYNVIRIDVDGDDTYLVRNSFYSHNK